jgi:SPASM domain peptide maturase of grasp-with-spasm system
MQSIDNQYLYVFANCFPVKGFKRSLICDTARKELHFIPTSFFELFAAFNEYTIGDVKEMVEEEDLPEMEKFIEFLINKELAEPVDDISLFPPIEINWDNPSPITNAIIDIDGKIHDMDHILTQLMDLRCQNLQIRSYGKINFPQFRKALLHLAGKRFTSVQILMKYDENVSKEMIQELTIAIPSIETIMVHSSPKEKKYKDPGKKYVGSGTILHITQTITSCETCGIINQQSLFIPDDLEIFMEHKLFNGCLNRKISVDLNGEIKNCPSMSRSYGNISETTLKEVLSNNEFREWWGINKDQIEICRDCEFRYICSDCRVYVEKQGDKYSKPAKCRYNPYTAVWEK